MNPARIRTVTRRLAATRPVAGSPARSDPDLLARFTDEHDEAAFAEIVARHLPAVRAVCRTLLRDPNDVDDAAQATFLVLVQRSATVRDRLTLGGWLYRVAWRTANRLRKTNARAVNRQAIGVDPDMTPARVGPAVDQAEVVAVLYDEIGQLPERYRLAVLCCYAAGTSTAEAAARLGWPKGTLLTRLAWARKRLCDRMAKRGLTLAGGLSGVLIPEPGWAGAAVLAGRITGAAVALAPGSPTARELASERMSSITQGVVSEMIGTNTKLIIGIGMLGMALVGLGLGQLASGQPESAPPNKQVATAITNSPKDVHGRDASPGTSPAAAVNSPRHWVGYRSRENGDGPHLRVVDENGDAQTFPATADAVLIAYLPGGAYGRVGPGGGLLGPSLSVDLRDQNRFLLRFGPLDAARARSAELVLTRQGDTMLPPRPFAVTFHEVMDKWDEGTVTWANQPRFADRPVATAVINAKEDTVRLDATKLARHGARHGWLVKVAEPLADGVTAPAEGGNKVAAVAFTEADYGDWRPADMVVLLERMLVAKPQKVNLGAQGVVEVIGTQQTIDEAINLVKKLKK